MDSHQNTILYDADCGFCTWCRKQVEKNDPKKLFRFINIRGTEALEISQKLQRQINQDNPDTVVLVTADNQWLEQSSAVKEICKKLSYPWRLLYFLLMIIPRPIADFFYRLAAKHRTRIGLWLGEDRCRL